MDEGWRWDSSSPQGMYGAPAFLLVFCFIPLPPYMFCLFFPTKFEFSEVKVSSGLSVLSQHNVTKCQQNLLYLNGVKPWSRFHYLFDTAGKWSTHLCNLWVITTYTENRLSAADQIHTCSTLNKPYILKHTFTTIEEK